MTQSKQQEKCASKGALKKNTVVWNPPESRQEMWSFLRRYLDLKIPDRRVSGDVFFLSVVVGGGIMEFRVCQEML
ncbi:MAG: hypothetical protein ACYTEU_11885 [Planctomycetota bacterium]|jgi:hypothetical protein